MLTKIKGFATFMAIIAALTIGFYLFDPKQGPSNRDPEDKRQVQLVVVTSADGENPRVTWQQSLTGPQSESITGVRWDKTVESYRGDRIYLSVTQKGSGLTQCYIISGEDEKTQWMVHPGTISCQYTVK